MKRSNTANVDPRTINFADVKRRLEAKIDKINSYQSKRGSFREDDRTSFSPIYQPEKNTPWKPDESSQPNESSPFGNSGYSNNSGRQEPQSQWGMNPQGTQGSQRDSLSSGNPYSSQPNESSPFGNSGYSNNSGRQEPQSQWGMNPQGTQGSQRDSLSSGNPYSSQPNESSPFGNSGYSNNSGRQEPQSQWGMNPQGTQGSQRDSLSSGNPYSSQPNESSPFANSGYSNRSGRQEPQSQWGMNPQGTQGSQRDSLSSGNPYSSQPNESSPFANSGYSNRSGRQEPQSQWGMNPQGMQGSQRDSSSSRNPYSYNLNRGSVSDPQNLPQVFSDSSSKNARLGARNDDLAKYKDGNTISTYPHNSPVFDDPSHKNYDIHKKLEFLEQERFNDLKSRAEDSKFSSLAKNLEKVEEKLENLQSPQFAKSIISPVDVSLELIQRKLDKLEQERIDSLRSKIEQERARDLEKSIEKLDSKIEGAYIAKGEAAYSQQSSDLLELIQKKLEKLEEDRVDTIRSKIEEDRTVEIARNLEKLESKISAKTSKDSLAQVAYLDALSKEDLLRKLDRLEQDRINDLKDIMDQEKILLINNKIEKLESKLDQAIIKNTNAPSSIEGSATEIAKKLERLEQNKIEDLKAKMEEEKLLALSKSLSNIESKIEGTKQTENKFSSAIEKILSGIVNRLEKLENDKIYSVNPSIESSNLERTIEKLESKIEKIVTPPSTSSPMETKYIAILDGIQRKLERLEKDRMEEFKDRAEENRFTSLERSLERIEDSLSSYSGIPFSAGAERDGLGKKLDRLEKDLYENLRSSQLQDKASALQKSLDKIELKLDSINDYKDNHSLIPQSFIDFNRRLEQIERKRQEDADFRLKNYSDSKLTKLLENIENRLATTSINPHILSQTGKKSDYIIEDLQKKLDKLEESRVNDVALKIEKERYNSLANHLDKIDSKIENSMQQSVLDVNPVVSQLSDKIAELGSKIEQKNHSQKEDANKKALTEIKESLGGLSNILISNPSNNSRIDKSIEKIYRKLNKLEESQSHDVVLNSESNFVDDTYTKQIINKNNVVLEHISNYLRDLTFELKNLYNKESQPNADPSNNKLIDHLVILQDKYLQSLQKIEHILEETYKSDCELKKYLLEQDVMSSEISKLKGDIFNKRDSSQTNILLHEINKLKTHIDDKSISSKLTDDVSDILGDIRNQQEVIKKSIEISQQIGSKKDIDEIPLIEDIKNLLTEVNYRNKTLNETVDDNHNRLSNVIDKVDVLFESFSKVENLINRISNIDNNEKYRKELEGIFAKLEESNSQIISVLNNNSLQSSLLSEKSGLLIKSLREDIFNIAQIEKKSILEDFSNLEKGISDFKSFISKQDIKEDILASSLGEMLVSLDGIANLQEETLNYFKSLDSNIERKLIDLSYKDDDLLSEVKLYLEDSQNRTNYFNQLKNKIDQNNVIISDFLRHQRPLDQIDEKVIGIASEFRITLDGLSGDISYLLENHDKTTNILNSLIEKTNEILTSEVNQEIKVLEINKDLKDKLENINNIQKQSLQTYKNIDEKASDIQLDINNIKFDIDTNIVKKVNLLSDNLVKSQEEISVLIKDVSIDSSNKLGDMQKDFSTVHYYIDKISSKTETTSKNIQELNDNVIKTKEALSLGFKDIEKYDDKSMNKLMDLQEELSNISSDFKTISKNTEEIKAGITESNYSLNKVSENIKVALSSLESINFDDTVKNISEKISFLNDQNKNLENLISGFQKEIKSNLSPYIVDKKFLENFTKFTDFSSEQIKSIKKSIQLFNTDLDMYLVEDKIMTNDQLVNLLTSFKQITDLQDNFFKVYSLNSDRLMDFAKKTESSIPEVDVKKAENIHSKIREVITIVASENQKIDIKEIVTSNNAKNTKKVDLLANMDYLNKEITKKTKK